LPQLSVNPAEQTVFRAPVAGFSSRLISLGFSYFNLDTTVLLLLSCPIH